MWKKNFSINASTFTTGRTYNYGVCVLDDINEVVIGFGTTPYYLYFYDLKTHRKKRQMNLSGWSWIWTIIRVSKDHIAVSGSASKIVVINFRNLSVYATLTGNTSYSYGVCNVGKDLIANASQDRSCRIWNWRKKICVQTIQVGANNGFLSVCHIKATNGMKYTGLMNDFMLLDKYELLLKKVNKGEENEKKLKLEIEKLQKKIDNLEKRAESNSVRKK